MSWQIRSRIFVVVAITVVLGVLGVSAVVTNWVSADALGDVAVSFDSSVQVFDNATGLVVDTIDTTNVPELTGANGGLAFDAPLNLWVANTDGNQLVKLLPANPHFPTAPPPMSPQASTQGTHRRLERWRSLPKTIYVARAGALTKTIQRIDPAGACVRSRSCPEITVPSDSATCVEIDLAPETRCTW